jgi:hypothetical protein
MRAIAGVLILAALLIGCTDTEQAPDVPTSPSTTVYLIDGAQAHPEPGRIRLREFGM